VNLADLGLRTAGDCRGVLVVLWACAAITFAVLATMIYSTIAFRRLDSDGAAARMSGKSQILWSLIPIGIFLGIAVTAVKELLFTGGRCVL
jgi:heme/copper-type cytochrome/quinol oxidase subunit 2